MAARRAGIPGVAPRHVGRPDQFRWATDIPTAPLDGWYTILAVAVIPIVSQGRPG
jgi:hypothetical protein